MSQPVSSQLPVADCYDLAVIGGGINGVGIAADAAGRGLKVFLCEKDDLAQHTSSASSKLIHGGLRYLEHYEFRLVRVSASAWVPRAACALARATRSSRQSPADSNMPTAPWTMPVWWCSMP